MNLSQLSNSQLVYRIRQSLIPPTRGTALELCRRLAIVDPSIPPIEHAAPIEVSQPEPNGETSGQELTANMQTTPIEQPEFIISQPVKRKPGRPKKVKTTV
jgi:hypothetical protein